MSDISTNFDIQTLAERLYVASLTDSTVTGPNTMMSPQEAFTHAERFVVEAQRRRMAIINGRTLADLAEEERKRQDEQRKIREKQDALWLVGCESINGDESKGE